MPITFKRAGQEAVTLENVSFKGVALDKVTFKRAGQEAVTVFEKAEAIGKWYFNSHISVTTALKWNVNFSSNNNEYTLMEGQPLAAGNIKWTALYYRKADSSYNVAYNISGNNDWYNEKFRTINITGGIDIANGNFITWLKANATKQT